MKNKFEISIGQIEGLESGQYEYKVVLNSMEQYLYDADTFEIQGDGNLTFSVIQNNFVLGGFAIPISKLKRCSKACFPLTNPFEELDEIPDTLDGPRIQMNIKLASLYTVQECNEDNFESPLFSPKVFSRNNVLQTLQLELHKKDEIITKLEQVIDKAHSENARLQNIVDEIAENFYKFQSECKEKEETLLNDVSNTKTAIADLSNQKLKLNEEVLSLKRQIEILQYKLSLKEIASEKIEIYDIESTISKLKESENKRKELQQLLNSSTNK